jgi:hypothetical protein
MVVMTVACGDSERRSKTKRAGVGEKAATKNGLPHLKHAAKGPFQQLSTLAVGTEPRVVCVHVHRGSTVPQIEHVGDPAALAVLPYRCESPKLEALAAWASHLPDPLPCARYRDIITCSNW